MRMPWKQEKTDRQSIKEFRRIPIRQIRKNPYQPRKLFDAQALQELAESIRQYGVITPLTVREVEDGFELIAGERRLRAAAMAGLSVVPCYIVTVSDRESSLMALLENLQRKDLDCFEEAASLKRLCEEFHMTQQEAASRLGKTQSAVANKIRLLKLDAETVAVIRNHALSERHARMLLQLEDAEARRDAALYMARRHMTVAQGEEYVERLLAGKAKAKRQGIIRDVRLFCNTVERAVKLMQSAGVKADYRRCREGEDLLLTVRVLNAVGPDRNV